MKIPEIDNAIQSCQTHVASLQARDPKIESFLTSYLLILMAIYFEKEIKRMVIDNIPTKTGCKKLNYYFEKTPGSKPRGLKTSQLPEFLGTFGVNCRKNFEKRCNNRKNAQIVAGYNNIIANRHNAAHQETINMTLSEVISAYNTGHTILDFVSESLKKRC
jgi:hypothetical protein